MTLFCLCMGDWTYMSSYEQSDPGTSLAHTAAGQQVKLGGFQPAYHRDNAVLCKPQGNKTTPMSLVKRKAWHCLSTVRTFSQFGSGSFCSSKSKWKRAFKTKMWAYAVQ